MTWLLGEELSLWQEHRCVEGTSDRRATAKTAINTKAPCASIFECFGAVFTTGILVFARQ